MVFSSLFKPKWQHRDPQIRRQAVQDLPESEREVLLQIARNDADSTVRQAATRRVSDLEVLHTIAIQDADNAARELAQQRYLRLLCGDDAAAPALAARLARTVGLTDARWVEHVARHGIERELRACAQQRVERDAVLGDIALTDPDPELRAQAAQRVAQKSTLERIARQARGKDKRVHGIARDKLHALQEREELPDRLRDAARTVCAKIESLADVADPESLPARRVPIVTEWSRLVEQWNAAGIGDFDPGLERRYALADAAVESRIAAHAAAVAQQQAQAAHLEELRAYRREICERLEVQLAELHARAEPPEDDTTLRQLLNTMNAAWHDLEALPADEAPAWTARFTRVTGELAGVLERSAQWRAEVAALRALLDDAQRVVASEREPNARQLDVLARRLRDARADRHVALREEVAAVLAQLRQRQAQIGERATAQRAAIEALVQTLEEHVSGGRTAQAFEIQQQIQAAMDVLAERDLTALRVSGVAGRFNAASKQLREWAKWKRWAGTPVKEDLVATMEELAREVQATAAKDMNIRDLAEHVRLAREQWKKLGVTESAGALWKRFDAACETVYAPCAARFDKEREQRLANAARLEKICDELQQYIADTDWENADWNAAERKLRDAARQWEHPGAIERGRRKALDARYKELTAALEQHLHKERTRNKFKKEALIKRAKQLVTTIAADTVDSRIVNDAIEAAKKLQEEWKSIGVSTEVETLWTQFRAEIDAVFTRRKAVFDVQDQQRADHLKRKEELCAAIEECVQLEGDAAAAARSRVVAAKTEFQSVGPVPRDTEKKIRARFERAVRDFDKRLADHAARLQQAQADALQRKAALCTALENALMQEPASLAAVLQQTQQDWQAQVALAEPMESKLTARWKTANELAASLSGDGRERARVDLRQRQEQQRLVAEELCLRLEIATGAESPPEQRDARMQYQVQRLAQKLSGGGADERSGEIDALRMQWWCVGPLEQDVREKLERRWGAAVGSVTKT